MLPSEEIAERIYNLFREGRMGKITFIQNFESLFYRDDNIGAYYLIWLLFQGRRTKDINYILRFAVSKIKRDLNRRV